MEKAKATYIPPPQSAKPKSSRASPRKSQRKRPLDDSAPAVGRASKRTKTSDAVTDDDEEEEASTGDVKDEAVDDQAFKQPTLVTGAKLKDYQLEGVAWMAGLYTNGISGILGTFFAPHTSLLLALISAKLTRWVSERSVFMSKAPTV